MDAVTTMEGEKPKAAKTPIRQDEKMEMKWPFSKSWTNKSCHGQTPFASTQKNASEPKPAPTHCIY